MLKKRKKHVLPFQASFDSIFNYVCIKTVVSNRGVFDFKLFLIL